MSFFMPTFQVYFLLVVYIVYTLIFCMYCVSKVIEICQKRGEDFSLGVCLIHITTFLYVILISQITWCCNKGEKKDMQHCSYTSWRHIYIYIYFTTQQMLCSLQLWCQLKDSAIVTALLTCENTTHSSWFCCTESNNSLQILFKILSSAVVVELRWYLLFLSTNVAGLIPKHCFCIFVLETTLNDSVVLLWSLNSHDTNILHQTEQSINITALLFIIFEHLGLNSVREIMAGPQHQQ